MRLAVGSDERTPLTDAVEAVLRGDGHDLLIVGPPGGGTEEWAEVGMRVGDAVSSGEADLGVLFCWSGTGASIAANKVRGVRAALCGDAETARMARKYNHANVLVMSLRATSEALGREILTAFMDEPPGSEDFDLRNVAAVDALDAVRDTPPPG